LNVVGVELFLLTGFIVQCIFSSSDNRYETVFVVKMWMKCATTEAAVKSLYSYVPHWRHSLATVLIYQTLLHCLKYLGRSVTRLY